MTSTSTAGVSSDRVQGPYGINLTDISCTICHEILWKPVFCDSCQTYFCLACITRWLEINPGKCPMRCARYTEKPCARFVKNHLAQLQISCIYRSSGCEEIVSYDTLEKHESQCNYRIGQCPGCQSEMLEKDLIVHEAQCPLIRLTCDDCNLTYLKKDADEHHTEVLCLKKQLMDVRRQSEQKIKQLTDDLEKHRNQFFKLNQDCTEYTRKITVMKKMMFESPVRITFNDIPDASMTIGTIPPSYKKLRWTHFSYMYEQYAKVNYPEEGYTTVFTTHSSPYIVWSSSSASINVERDTQVFGIVSLEACAIYNDNVKLTITGYRNSIPLYTHTSTLLFGKSESIELWWTDIHTLQFKSTGGTPRRKLSGGPHFLLTSVTVAGPR